MVTVVTGAAGFIGSTLIELLLRHGERVVGIDAFTDYYSPEAKRANLTWSSSQERFELVEADLAHDPLEPLLDGADIVFHLAGQPGVRPSWSEHFGVYVERNIVATQRLLEAARRVRPERIVYASSSSIYGEARRYPTTEDDLPAPHSPYGVTKLGGEHLCGLYAANFGLPVVSTRYFTVYGPRQRPDMAFHRLIEAALHGRSFPLLGSGEQRRDFTYVEDVVGATWSAGVADVAPGTVMNVAGSQASLRDAIGLVEELSGRTVALERRAASAGDVRRTGGAIERARRLLGWEPVTSLRDGLDQQLRWQATRTDGAIIDLTTATATVVR